MFELLFKLFQVIVKAVFLYATTDEGEAELKSILDEAEKDGIDIPFYEPSQGATGERGDVGNIGTTAPQSVVDTIDRSAQEARKAQRAAEAKS